MRKKTSDEKIDMPKWLLYAIIVLLVLSLIAMLVDSGPQRKDFPSTNRVR